MPRLDQASRLMRSFVSLTGLFCLGLLWAMHIVLAKLIDAQTVDQALAVMVIYLTAEAILLLLAFLIVHRRLPRLRAAWVFFLVTALLGYILPVQLDLIVAPQLPISHLALITSSGSMMALLISWIMRLEKPNVIRFMGVALGFAAVVTLLGNPWAQDFTLNYWYGLALLLPLTYAMADCYIDKYWPKGMGTFEIAVGDTLMALVMLVLMLLIYPTPFMLVKPLLDSIPLLLTGLVIATLISMFLFYALINHFGAVFVSAAIYPALFMGIVLGKLLFDEVLSPQFWLALIALLAGLVVVEYSNRQKSSQR